MKRNLYLFLAAVLFGTLSLTLAFAQQTDSLGDYARAVKKGKKPASARQFDNDNLPRSEKLSVVGSAPDESKTEETNSKDAMADAHPSATSGTADKAEDKSGKTPTTTPAQAKEDREKAYSDWKDKIAGQKDKIDLMSRELDVMQREYKLRAAAMYADAGNRLRNSAAWDKEDEQYKQHIADKQKALDDAKQALEDIKEEARRSGVPSSQRE